MRRRSARARSRPTRSSSTPIGRRRGDPAVVAAQQRLVAELRRDPEIIPATIVAPFARAAGAGARRPTWSTPTAASCRSAPPGAPTPASSAAIDLVAPHPRPLRPGRPLPRGTEVLVSGAPAFGVDFVDRAYGAFPWLVLAVLVVAYLLLLRAFRSVVLPAKAVVMNLLSVSATYGVLVLAFQHGWGEPFGLQPSPQIEGWIPIFLFAMLFGLSMDYEVFLLSRIREEWDRRQTTSMRSRTGSSTPAASSRPRR